jgi:N-acetyl-gamma-glutamyl-phosphate reductase
VLFAPAVGAYRQGMLVEVPLQLAALPSSPSVEVVHGALSEAYAGCRFVEVAELETTEAMTGIDPEGLNGTNKMRLHVFGDRAGEQVRLVALLDNLGKGASGAAVQSLNLMLGLDEAKGLS